MKTSPILYSLTDQGKTYYKLIDSTFSDSLSQTGHQRPQFLLHHDRYKFKIIKYMPIQMGNELQMNNWLKQWDVYKNCTIVLNGESSIEVHVKDISGSNPYELENKARKVADQSANLIENQYGMILGRSIKIGKPHIVNLQDDEIWQYFKDKVHIETPYAIIDKTPKEGLEHKGIESAINYANMGNNITNLMQGFNQFSKKMVQDQDNQLQLLTQIRDLLDIFVKSQEYKPKGESDRKEIQ